MEIEKKNKNWKMDTLNWSILKVEYLIKKVIKKLKIIYEIFPNK
jgi:hypothetical protein